MDSQIHAADLTKGMEHVRPYVSVSTSNKSLQRRSSSNNSSSSVSPAMQHISSPNPIYGVPPTVMNPIPRPPQRSHSPSNKQKRSDPFQFGSRYLEEGDDVFEFNAWDHVEVDEGFKIFAEEQYRRQREAPVSEFDRSTLFSVLESPSLLIFCRTGHGLTVRLTGSLSI